MGGKAEVDRLAASLDYIPNEAADDELQRLGEWVGSMTESAWD